MSERDRAPEGNLSILFVGTVVPDTPTFRGAAFSPPGNLFQTDLLQGLAGVGHPPTATFSQRPERLFPRSSRLWERGGIVEILPNVPVRLVPYLNLPVLRPVTVGLGIAASISRVARRARPGRLVVFTYNLSEPPGLFTWLGARLAGVRAVAFVCDVHQPGILVADSWSRRLDLALHKWLLPRFDGLVVVNELIASDFAPHVPFIRVEGGVSARMLAVGERRIRHSDGTFRMVAAGSLHEGNGIAEILEAMRLLPDAQYRLQIAGAGPLEGSVRQAMARDARIEYCGLLTFGEVLDLYSEADALLNIRVTDRVDTKYYFPSKTMEYLASGVPVISTSPGKVREELAGLAFFLADESPETLARTIAAVASMPREERDRIGQAARDFVATNRTWTVQAGRIIEFLREGIP